MEIASYSDEALMELYRNGEELAFKELYKRYAKRVYGYLQKRLAYSPYPNDAGDLLQAVFMKFHASRTKYDSKYSLASWMFLLSHSVLVDHVRKKNPTVMEEEKLLSLLDANQPISEGEVQPELERVIQSLPETSRELLRMRYEEGLNFEEMAKKTGLESATVRKRVSRLLTRLRQSTGGDKSET